MRAKLADYDRRILAEERELARGRGVFRFKYFQWLALPIHRIVSRPRSPTSPPHSVGN